MFSLTSRPTCASSVCLRGFNGIIFLVLSLKSETYQRVKDSGRIVVTSGEVTLKWLFLEVISMNFPIELNNLYTTWRLVHSFIDIYINLISPELWALQLPLLLESFSGSQLVEPPCQHPAGRQRRSLWHCQVVSWYLVASEESVITFGCTWLYYVALVSPLPISSTCIHVSCVV